MLSLAELKNAIEELRLGLVQNNSLNLILEKLFSYLHEPRSRDEYPPVEEIALALASTNFHNAAEYFTERINAVNHSRADAAYRVLSETQLCLGDTLKARYFAEKINSQMFRDVVFLRNDENAAWFRKNALEERNAIIIDTKHSDFSIKEEDREFILKNPTVDEIDDYFLNLKLPLSPRGLRMRLCVRFLLKLGQVDRALELTQMITDKEVRWGTLSYVADEVARTDISKALKITKKIKSHDNRAFAELDLAIIQLNQQQLESAVNILETVIKIIDEMKTKYSKDRFYALFIEKIISTGEFELALKLYNKIEGDRKKYNERYLYDGAIILGFYFLSINEPVRAIGLGDRIERCLDKHNFLSALAYFSGYLNKNYVRGHWYRHIPSAWIMKPAIEILARYKSIVPNLN